MKNADVILSARECFKEDKDDLWEVWDEKPVWVSAKEVYQQEAQDFWDNWDDTPKLSRRENAEEDDSDEESEDESDTPSSEEDTETMLEHAKSTGEYSKMLQEGGLVSAKEIFKAEDECWWRDAVEDLDKPKNAISAKEYFKNEQMAWWDKEHGSDEES